MDFCHKHFVFRFAVCILFATRVLSIPVGWEVLPENFLTGSNIAQLDAGISKSIWAVNQRGKPHVKVGLKGQWSTVTDSENLELSWVSSGAAGVWAVRGSLGVPVFREGITEQKISGSKWLPVEGRGFKIIESGLAGCVYALTRKGELYYRDGITALDNKGTSWKQIWGRYRFLSAGSYGVWTVDFYNRIFFGKGSSAHLSLVKNWKEVDRPVSSDIRSVVAGFDGTVFALSTDGFVFKRNSVHVLNPTGKPNSWQKIDGIKLKQISAGLPGVIGITFDDSVVGHQGKLNIL